MKRRLRIWSGLAYAIVCICKAGYYFLANLFLLSFDWFMRKGVAWLLVYGIVRICKPGYYLLIDMLLMSFDWLMRKGEKFTPAVKSHSSLDISL